MDAADFSPGKGLRLGRSESRRQIDKGRGLETCRRLGQGRK